MNTKLFILAFSLIVFGLSLGVSGSAFPNRRSFSFLSSQDANRSHGRRRSISLANLPGSAAQIVPNEAMEWAIPREMCHSKEIFQNVSQPGCESKSIKNVMCYGVCMSVHMPGVLGSEELEMCSQCKPKGKKKLLTVTLKCAGGTTRTITVPTVDKCGCQPCNPSRI